MEEPFPVLFSDLDMAPPVSALNPSQKRGHWPEPSRRREPVAADAPVSPAANIQPGFFRGTAGDHKSAHSVLSGATCPFFSVFRLGTFAARSVPTDDALVRGPPGFPILRHQPLFPGRPGCRPLSHLTRNLALLGLPTLLS